MGKEYILSCESTVDMPYAYVAGRNIPVMFYTYTVNDRVYVDTMGKDPEELPGLYASIEAGNIPSTSQLNEFNYEEFFTGLLDTGRDLLHIAFGSGMTGSVNNAFNAAEELREKYPEQKIVVIDSTCSSSGYGMLIDYAADLRDEGKSIDEVAAWVTEHCHKIHHQFFTTDLKYFRRTGRMSGTAAGLAAVLGICPLMRLNYEGRIIAYGKARGRKGVIKETVDVMKAHAEDGTNYSGRCYICNSRSMEDAGELKKAIQADFPNIGEVRIFDIGPIILSHCGPGTCSLFFLGDDRPE